MAPFLSTGNHLRITSGARLDQRLDQSSSAKSVIRYLYKNLLSRFPTASFCLRVSLFYWRRTGRHYECTNSTPTPPSYSEPYLCRTVFCLITICTLDDRAFWVFSDATLLQVTRLRQIKIWSFGPRQPTRRPQGRAREQRAAGASEREVKVEWGHMTICRADIGTLRPDSVATPDMNA